MQKNQILIIFALGFEISVDITECIFQANISIHKCL